MTRRIDRGGDLVLLILFALALRVWLFVGFTMVDPPDDLEYFTQLRANITERHEGLQSLARDVQAEEYIWSPRAILFRVGALIPMRLAVLAFGINESAAALPSLLASLATLALVFWIGTSQFNRNVGRIAALLFAVFPLELVLSTRILSESQHLLWFTGTMALSIAAMRSSSDSKGHLLAGASGITWLVAYLCRKTAFFALPVLVFHYLWHGKTWRERTRFASFAFVCLVGLAAENDYYTLVTGVSGLSFSAERAAHLSNYQTSVAIFPVGDWLRIHNLYEFGVPHHFIKLGLGVIRHYDDLKLFGWFAPVGLLSLGFALWRRRAMTLAVWTGVIFFYVQYGFVAIIRNPSDGVIDYFLVPQQIRYLIVLVPPLTLLIAAFIEAKFRSRPILGAAVLAAITVHGLFHGVRNHAFYRGSLEDLRRAAAFLENEPAPVYTDPWAARQLAIFTNRPLRDFTPLQRLTDVPNGAWVLTGGSRGYDLVPADVFSGSLDEAFDLHLAVVSPPPHWREVFRYSGPRLPQRVSDLVIFQVGASPRAPPN